MTSITFITSVGGDKQPLSDCNDRRFFPVDLSESKTRKCDNCGEFGECCQQDDATVAGLHASIGILSNLVDQQRQLLIEVEDVCGRDGHGAPFEDGESDLIDRVRDQIAAVAPPAAPMRECVTLDVTLDDDAAKMLHDMLGDDREDLSPVRLVVGDGHSGYGLYVAQADYQDEGAVLVASITPPAALIKQEWSEVVAWRLASPLQNCKIQRPWNIGKPNENDIAYWVNECALEIEYAYAAPQQLKSLSPEQRAKVSAAWRDGNGTASELINLVEAALGIKEGGAI